MCKTASMRPSSHYVTGSDPFLEPKERRRGWEAHWERGRPRGRGLLSAASPRAGSVPVNKPSAPLQLCTPPLSGSHVPPTG